MTGKDEDQPLDPYVVASWDERAETSTVDLYQIVEVYEGQVSPDDPDWRAAVLACLAAFGDVDGTAEQTVLEACRVGDVFAVVCRLRRAKRTLRRGEPLALQRARLAGYLRGLGEEIDRGIATRLECARGEDAPGELDRLHALRNATLTFLRTVEIGT